MYKDQATLYTTIEARKERIERFKLYVAQNRKTLNAKRLVANFALSYGLREHLVKEYLDLLIHAGVYTIWNGKLLTHHEREKAVKEWEIEQKKREVEAKKIRERLVEGYASDDALESAEFEE